MIIMKSANLYQFLTGIVILVQGFFTSGLTWEKVLMGGKLFDKYPFLRRIIAVVNMTTLALMILLVLTRKRKVRK